MSAQMFTAHAADSQPLGVWCWQPVPMPTFADAPSPRVYTVFDYPGEPFVCALDGKGVTARQLRNRVAAGLPTPDAALALMAEVR